MPSHPDRVRKNYTTTDIFHWKSILDHTDFFTIKVTTAEIATCMTKYDYAMMLGKKIRDEILKVKDA